MLAGLNPTKGGVEIERLQNAAISVAAAKAFIRHGTRAISMKDAPNSSTARAKYNLFPRPHLAVSSAPA